MSAPGDALLERTDELEALATGLAQVSASGRGRLVLVAGEAGIGKTALVDAFAAQVAPTRVLTGACEALRTPRPLGPLLDIAADVGGDLAEIADAGASPSDVVRTLLRELRRQTPTLVVLEDLHWADEATLDLLRLLARRIATVPALVVATHRDELDRTHPLRVLLGELPRPAAGRIGLRPLSVGAVAALAGPHGVDAGQLHSRTSGNPFYVTEALAGGGALPETVLDAVLARAARLGDGARALLDAVAVVPPRAELWLLEAIASEHLEHLEACIASGMLRSEDGGVAFRHEIARVAIDDALPPDRRIALHRRVLPALAGRADVARLAHHAESAGDAEAVLRHATAAGDRAARLGSHNEAAEQFARALRFAPHGDARLDLLERRSYACYLTNDIPGAVDARREALAVHAERGDRRRAGDSHRWLSRLAWFSGDNATAEGEALAAVRLLEAMEHGPELAMAWSNTAQLRMLADDLPGTLEWGVPAIDLAQRLDEVETLAHALCNVGAAEGRAGLPEGREKLRRSLDLALEAGLEEHAARAHTNLSCGAIRARRYTEGDRCLEVGLAYCRDRDLDSWRLYMLGWAARSHLEQGRWDDAAQCASTVLRESRTAPTRISALTVLGRLRARRGDPDVWSPLDEAGELAPPTGELQRIVPAVLARAEARWLGGEAGRIAAETDEALMLARRNRDTWAVGELTTWRRRAGIEPSTEDLALCEDPFRLELTGDAVGAATAWRALGCPYEAALAPLAGEDPDAMLAGLEELRALGATASAARVARALRERGVRNLRQGPRRATRANPAGLTVRELEVLRLLAEGMRNAQIAERLVVSPKTVGHHVSAILRKLGTATRTQAAAEAARLQII